MFIDLKSSTTIAEKLGGKVHHQFFKEVFADITRPIMESEAEIYQYVGDEVVVSRAIDRLRNKGQIVHSFYRIADVIKFKRENYKERFGNQPEFKAGAHLGDVIAGEIGIIKRDITYSGDVLNTTVSIQG